MFWTPKNSRLDESLFVQKRRTLPPTPLSLRFIKNLVLKREKNYSDTSRTKLTYHVTVRILEYEENLEANSIKCPDL